MRIAFVSYEFPPDTAHGGIATYVAQITRSLVDAGAEVEVFCGSPLRTDFSLDRGVRVHRIKTDRMAFPTAIAPVFLKHHRVAPFDVLEGPDFLAEARYITRALIHLPYVLKLHTPYYFAQKVGRLPYGREQLRSQLKLLWYVAKTRNIRALSSRENPLFREERNHLLQADEICAPSQAAVTMVTREWKLDPSRVSLVPFPFQPPPEMLAIPVDTSTRRITFVGRLEWRKGVQDLAAAVPLVLQRHPDARFRFVGASGTSPQPGVSMKEYLLAMVSPHQASVEFVGKVPPHSISRYLAETDICVFPSLWESFGFVVLEAMAAGRAVICTDNGGMAEILGYGDYGLLVPPKSPRDIAGRIVQLLENDALRFALGHKAREQGLARYDASQVVPLQFRTYERAIDRRRGAFRSPVRTAARFSFQAPA